MKPSSLQLIEIDDRMLCVRVRGQGPTVVLEAGGAGDGTTDAYGETFEEQLTRHATVVTYDRAGSGRSDGPPHRTVAAMADDLAAMLAALGLRTPAVVVGWSSGGLVAQLFTARHPNMVAGLVLLDPTVMSVESRLGERVVGAVGVAQLEMLALGARLGFFRTRSGRAVVRRLAGPYADQKGMNYWYDAWNEPRQIRQTARIMPLLGDYCREVTTTIRAASLPDVPVRVLVPRTRPGGGRVFVERIEAAHRSLAERFPRGKLVLMDDATHAIPIDQPDAVLTEILDVLGTLTG